MHSFIPKLKKWLREVKPARVIEWGPGKSTEIIRKKCPNALIVSIEHDERWLKPTYVYVPIPHNKPSQYDAWPLIHTPDLEYDFAFIDGRRRAACILTASMCLRPGGIAIVHDAKRKHYQHAYGLMEVVELGRTTAVLRKPE